MLELELNVLLREQEYTTSQYALKKFCKDIGYFQKNATGTCKSVNGLLSHSDLNPAISVYEENIWLNMDNEDFVIHDQIS